MKIITPSFHNEIKIFYLINDSHAICIRKMGKKIAVGILKFDDIENWIELVSYNGYIDSSFGWMNL